MNSMPALDYRSSEKVFANPVNQRLEEMKKNLNEMALETGEQPLASRAHHPLKTQDPYTEAMRDSIIKDLNQVNSYVTPRASRMLQEPDSPGDKAVFGSGNIFKSNN